MRVHLRAYGLESDGGVKIAAFKGREELTRRWKERIWKHRPLARQLPLKIWMVEINEFGETTKSESEGGIMKLQSRIATSIGLMLVLANVAFAQQVKTDYDHSANFGQYKTYSWEKVQTKDPLQVQRIKSAVNSALAAKGMTEVASGGDVEVF